jgi:hypothetical protein
VTTRAGPTLADLDAHWLTGTGLRADGQKSPLACGVVLKGAPKPNFCPSVGPCRLTFCRLPAFLAGPGAGRPSASAGD